MEVTETVSTLERAEELVLDGQLEQAIALLQGLAGQVLPSSERGRALALQAVCLERIGRADEADRLIAESMKEEGDDHAFVLAAGMEFSEYESFLHAEIFLRNLCDLRPDDHVPWFNLAVTLGREGRYQEAAALYDEALRCDPKFAEAHFQQAYCHSLLQNYAASAASYRRFLEIEPEDGEAWQALAVVESDRGELEAAYAAFERAAGLAEEPAEVYYNWAVTAVRRRDVATIERCVEKLQDIDPEDWRTMLVRADWEETEENLWAAWELLNEALAEVLNEENEEHDDPVLQSYVAATVLRFAQRHDMGDHADETITAIFQHRVFEQETLEALRQFQARFSNQARSFQVVLEVAEDGSFPHYVVYGVSAATPDEAAEIAQDFQRRVKPEPCKAHSIGALTNPDEGAVGVYWRSEELAAPPGEDEAL